MVSSSLSVVLSHAENYDLFHATHPDFGPSVLAHTWRVNRWGKVLSLLCVVVPGQIAPSEE